MTRPGSILIVDDDQDIRDVLKFILEADGYSVDVAVDGVDAWEKLTTANPPVLIFLDLMMPHMDGEQLLRKLRLSRLAAVPVVIMSGHNDASRKMVELNANGCLTKPVEFDELLDTVMRFVPAHWRRSGVA